MWGVNCPGWGIYYIGEVAQITCRGHHYNYQCLSLSNEWNRVLKNPRQICAPYAGWPSPGLGLCDGLTIASTPQIRQWRPSPTRQFGRYTTVWFPVGTRLSFLQRSVLELTRLSTPRWWYWMASPYDPRGLFPRLRVYDGLTIASTPQIRPWQPSPTWQFGRYTTVWFPVGTHLSFLQRSVLELPRLSTPRWWPWIVYLTIPLRLVRG